MVCLRIAARSTNNSPDSLWSLDSAFGTRIFEGVPHGWYFEQKYRFLANEGGGGVTSFNKAVLLFNEPMRLLSHREIFATDEP